MEKDKLIFAGDLEKAIRDDHNISGRQYARVKQHIQEAKPVESVPVLHGCWEDEHGGKYANPRYRCSVCKAKALYKFERDLLDNWKEKQALTPICPYCGAVLDGERG